MCKNKILKLIYKFGQNLKNTELVDKYILQYETGMGTTTLVSGYPSIIITLAMYEKFFNDITWAEVNHKYIVRFRDNLSKYGYCNASLYSGITGMAMSIYLASNKLTRYQCLLKTLNDIVYKETKDALKYYEKNIPEIKESHYDVIQGISGNLRYLLYFKNKPRVKQLIIDIINYLVKITRNDENGVPIYLVKGYNLFLESYREKYKSGSLNQSLSHGITGPLVVLALALKEGIEVEGQMDAIKSILNFLKEFAYVETYKKNDEEISKVWWNGRVSKEDYINKKINPIKSRASWCYGTPGIARSMYIAADIVRDSKTKKFALEALIGLCFIDKDELHFDSAQICHGFSGLIMILDTMYKETNMEIFKYGTKNLYNSLIELYNEDFEFGFINFDYSFDGKTYGDKEFRNELGILEGATGSILTLMNLINNNDMDWKNIFLIKQ